MHPFGFQFQKHHGGGVIQSATPGQPCGCPLPDNVRKPSGCVTVYDNMLDQWDQVREVKVLVSRTQFFGWAFHRTAVTGGKGCWEINHNYRKKINIWVKYESPTCNVKVMETAVGIWGYTWPYQPYIGQYGGPNFNNIGIGFNWTNNIDSKQFRNWAAATANNSVFEFQNYSATNSLPNPPGNLKILITPWGDDNVGAAPMLEKLGITGGAWSVTTASILGGVFGIFSGVPPYLIAFPFGAAITIAAPDLVLNINDANDVNADDFRALFYHELAHAQHAMQAGPVYWNNNIGYVAEHDGYGQANFLGAGSCAVIEMWGWQNGPRAAHRRYLLKHSNTGTDPIINTWEAELEETTFVWGFLPVGWQHDLLDNNAVNPNGITDGVPDAVTGFTQAQIFSTLTPNMNSPHQQRLALQALLPPGITLQEYLDLANAYGL